MGSTPLAPKSLENKSKTYHDRKLALDICPDCGRNPTFRNKFKCRTYLGRNAEYMVGYRKKFKVEFLVIFQKNPQK